MNCEIFVYEAIKQFPVAIPAGSEAVLSLNTHVKELKGIARISMLYGNMEKRDAQILCGLLLSKFDQKALAALGFSSFVEAFNVLGAALGARPASIKGYRDELDPFFPNKRVGWHQRPLRVHCKKVLEEYGKKSMKELVLTIKGLLDPLHDIAPQAPMLTEASEDSENSSFAKRLMTGRAAEGFFLRNFRNHVEFVGGTIVDTTMFGCGFDFRVNFEESDDFFVVEVKGLQGTQGGISLSAKERARAEQLRKRFFLCVVSNFKDVPQSRLWCDPLNAGFTWKRSDKTQVISTWNTTLHAQ